MKTFAKMILGRFSRRYDYDVSYLHELAEVSPGAVVRYLMVAPLGQYRKTAPIDAYFAAKLVATRRADCGPCLKLVVNMAREAKVDEAAVKSVLRNKPDGASDDVQLTMRYASAVTFGTFYPMLKRGLGHAQSCEPITHALLG